MWWWSKRSGKNEFMNKPFSDLTHLLYKRCLKPIFFRFDPEFVHDQLVRSGTWLGRVPLARKLVAALWSYQDPKLVKTLNGISFPNPIGLSAGFDYNGNLSEILAAVGFGWHTIGTVTLHPYQGNAKPRLGRLPASRALLVNKGLKNIGAVALIRHLKKVNFQIPTGISIASTNQAFPSETAQIAEILACFRLFEKSDLKHAYYELNISCPNTFGGEPFTTASKLQALMKKMDTVKLTRPLFVKMPIDQNDQETLALLQVLNEHRVAGVIFGNLTKDKQNPAVAKEDVEFWLSHKGNLSGKPTWDRSNRLVALTRRHFQNRFTIIGTGGIFSGTDAAQKLGNGADLLQMITGMIYEGPQVIGQINYDIAHVSK